MIRSTRITQQRQGLNLRVPNQFNMIQNGPVSFSSLSKNKDQKVTQSQIVNRFSPTVKNMLHSQFKENKDSNISNLSNKQNVVDQYRLFTNIVKHKLENEKNNESKYKQPIQFAKGNIYQNQIKNQYFDTLKPQSKIEGKPQRPQSRHKIQKYFSETPVLIRPKSSKSDGNLRIKTEPHSQQLKEDKDINNKNPVQARTFPPNQYLLGWQQPAIELRGSLEDVNTSKASVKFDMSPCWN